MHDSSLQNQRVVMVLRRNNGYLVAELAASTSTADVPFNGVTFTCNVFIAALAVACFTIRCRVLTNARVVSLTMVAGT